MTPETTRVVVMRGVAANPWELRPWELLHAADDFEVKLVVAPDNLYDVSSVRLPVVPVRTTGGLMPPGSPGRALLKAVGQRHLGLSRALEGADVVHAAELGYWFSRQAARLKPRMGFRLVVTVWETLPFLDAYRNFRTRAYRREVLEATDLFLPTTERAAQALLLEGVPRESMEICPPGIDLERFGADPGRAPDRHTVVSIGRLVWEKGHQDLLRAVARIISRGGPEPRVVIVGTGPEERRLHAVARDLGVDGLVEFRGFMSHDEVPTLLARASCLVLASIPTPYWEEQFGMVLAEAMAARVPVLAAESGAIPEVLSGYGRLFAPGDWVGLADALAEGPLAAAPGARATPEHAVLERLSSAAAAERLQRAYARVGRK